MGELAADGAIDRLFPNRLTASDRYVQGRASTKAGQRRRPGVMMRLAKDRLKQEGKKRSDNDSRLRGTLR